MKHGYLIILTAFDGDIPKGTHLEIKPTPGLETSSGYIPAETSDDLEKTVLELTKLQFNLLQKKLAKE